MPQLGGALEKNTSPVMLCKPQAEDFGIDSGYNELPLEILLGFVFKLSRVFCLFCNW